MSERVVLADTKHDLWQRLDAAEILKRFHCLERGIVLGGAGWIPGLRQLESKAAVARLVWQASLTADALRERVFELRYPSRLLEEGADAPLIRLYEASLHAPSPSAYLQALQQLLIPALREAYIQYLDASDALADGPSQRFLAFSVEEKLAQMSILRDVVEAESALESSAESDTDAWIDALRGLLERLGAVRLDPPPADVTVPNVVPPGRPFELIEDPGRDRRYATSSIYWPDVIDPSFPYGEGVALQIRSAVSHLNEVWAVDTAGAILQALASRLGWDYIRDAARWLYDESRHMLMGAKRLEAWGFEPTQIPLGGYIYEACIGQDAIYRLGMLGYFETKNIGKKRERAKAFRDIGDLTSERHMEFDWADETIHAEYGRRWLKALLKLRGEPESNYTAVLERCGELVDSRIHRATDEERDRIIALAQTLLAEAVARTRLS